MVRPIGEAPCSHVQSPALCLFLFPLLFRLGCLRVFGNLLLLRRLGLSLLIIVGLRHCLGRLRLAIIGDKLFQFRVPGRRHGRRVLLFLDCFVLGTLWLLRSTSKCRPLPQVRPLAKRLLAGTRGSGLRAFEFLVASSGSGSPLIQSAPAWLVAGSLPGLPHRPSIPGPLSGHRRAWLSGCLVTRVAGRWAQRLLAGTRGSDLLVFQFLMALSRSGSLLIETAPTWLVARSLPGCPHRPSIPGPSPGQRGA